jgi:hypothetical protein
LCAAAALAASRCGGASGLPSEPELVRLQIACTTQAGVLACRAQATFDTRGHAATDPVDVTSGVSWITSDERVATVDHGHIFAVGPGAADIRATIPTRHGPEASAVSVLVKEGLPPQLAYTVEGELRDINSIEIAGASVTLIDGDGKSRAVTTGPSGGFRFFPVGAGYYRLNGEKSGFRANYTNLTIPGDKPLTLVLLREPDGDGSLATLTTLPLGDSKPR